MSKNFIEKVFNSALDDKSFVIDNKVDEQVVVSIYDKISGVFGLPMFSQNVDSAKRLFGDIVQGGDNLIVRHPEDYQLFYLGTFNDKSGLLSALEIPQFLANACDYVKISSNSAAIYDVQTCEAEA